MAGVLINRPPYAPTSPIPRSSASTRTTFGRESMLLPSHVTVERGVSEIVRKPPPTAVEGQGARTSRCAMRG